MWPKYIYFILCLNKEKVKRGKGDVVCTCVGEPCLISTSIDLDAF